MRWSEYQGAIFDAVEDPNSDDLIVEARAGCAKTTTIIEAVHDLPKTQAALLTAFNKGIVKEMKERAPGHTEVRSLHSLGFKAVKDRFGSDIEVDERRTRKIVERRWNSIQPEVKTGLCNAVSAAKNMLASTPEEIDEAMFALGVSSGIEFPKEKRATTSMEEIDEWHRQETIVFLKRAWEVLEESKGVDGTIDFDDMIWLPPALDLRVLNYDRVFVDEAQDVNPAQIEMVLRAAGKGRLIAIGDDRQAIYGWRGARSDLMRIKGAERLPLPICYRCGKSIVRLAQKLVPDIQEWSKSGEGLVDRREDLNLVDEAQPGDAILSRTNAPLTGLWFAFLRARKGARVLGRSMGSGLAAFIRRSKADTIEDLLRYTEQWFERELKSLEKKGRNRDSAVDKAASILYLCEGAGSVGEVLRTIESMFTQSADKPDRIMLSTVHAAKGLEYNRVFVLLPTFSWRADEEEENILYVALTRAKRELFLVGSAADYARAIQGVRQPSYGREAQGVILPNVPTPERVLGLFGRDLDL